MIGSVPEPLISPAIADGASLAYVAARRSPTIQGRHELGAHSHGPNTHRLAEHLCEQIRTWDTDRTTIPTITAYQDGNLGEFGGHAMAKRHTIVGFRW